MSTTTRSTRELECLRNHARGRAACDDVSDADRALWEQIADELDAYLEPAVDLDVADDDPGLFADLLKEGA